MTRVSIVTDQPVLARGFQETLSAAGLDPVVVADFDRQSIEGFQSAQPDVVMLDLTGEFTFETLADLHASLPGSNVVIRVGPMSRELIFQALESGVRGILPVTLSPEVLVQSLERIAKGEVLIEVSDPGYESMGEKRVSFSEREKQVVELLAQGLKNKEIAAAMSLAEGTVKVYLSRLFKKTKVRDRFELMLYRAHDRKLLTGSDLKGRATSTVEVSLPPAEFAATPEPQAELVPTA